MTTLQATPEEGVNVKALLSDGSEVIAYWKDEAWWMGVDNSYEDQLLASEVVSWRGA